jgi:hypothetical protein
MTLLFNQRASEMLAALCCASHSAVYAGFIKDTNEVWDPVIHILL